MDCSWPGLPVPHHLPEFAQGHVHCISDAVQPSHPLTPSSPSAPIFRSIRDFSNESSVHIRPKYWSFNFSFSPSSEYSELISLKIDWFDLLVVQGTFRSLLQHHSSKASILWRSAFFTVQLLQPYVTTGKIIALTIQTFVGRVMSLLFNTLWKANCFSNLPGFVIAFLPGSSCLVISWLQPPSIAILEPKKRKPVTTFSFPPSICHAIMGPDAIILVFLIFSLKLALSLYSLTLIKRLFSSSSLSAIRMGSSTYLRLLIFSLPILIPACNSSSLAFLMMCSVYRLNKQVTADSPAVLLSQSWTNQLFHTGF